MIMSFGYKVGAPSTRVDKTFDVRELTHDTTSPAFLQQFRDIVDYGRANPSHRIAVGCEQGKHRSVVLSNKAAAALRTSVYHRDAR